MGAFTGGSWIWDGNDQAVQATPTTGGYTLGGVGPKFEFHDSVVTNIQAIEFQRDSNRLVLSWTNMEFTLQAAAAASGTFTNVPDASSPYTSTLDGSEVYFRLAR
jgi:hypothetical protein